MSGATTTAMFGAAGGGTQRSAAWTVHSPQIQLGISGDAYPGQVQHQISKHYGKPQTKGNSTEHYVKLHLRRLSLKHTSRGSVMRV